MYYPRGNSHIMAQGLVNLEKGRGKAAAVQAKLARITAVLGAVSEGGGGEAGHPGV